MQGIREHRNVATLEILVVHQKILAQGWVPPQRGIYRLSERQFPHAHWRDQIDAAIQLNGLLQAGGWQDVIASAYEGTCRYRAPQKRLERLPTPGSRTCATPLPPTLRDTR